MRGFSRIWVLVLGVAVAIIIVAAAFLIEGKAAPTFSGTNGVSKPLFTPKSSTLLKNLVERINLRNHPE